MKKLDLENASFRYIEQSFREWLDILGYSEITVYNLPNMVRELLHYMESQRLNNIKDLTIQTIEEYYNKLKERSNQRKDGGALSSGHLNKHIQALRKFTEYLRTVGRVQIPLLRLENEATETYPEWLTKEESGDLLKTSYIDNSYNFKATQAAFRSRDRAIIAIFYGCGLRRNEGVHVDVSDINFDNAILHVRKGKAYKERFVPISPTSIQCLQEYIYDYRSALQTGFQVHGPSRPLLKYRQGGRVLQPLRLPQGLPPVDPHMPHRIRRRQTPHRTTVQLGPGLQIRHIAVRFIARADNAMRGLLPHPIHLTQAQAKSKAALCRFQRAIPLREIHIHTAHLNPVFARIPHDLRRRIKPHRLGIEQGTGKGRRVVTLHP